MCVLEKYRFAPVDDGSSFGILKWNTAEKRRNVARYIFIRKTANTREKKTAPATSGHWPQLWVVICGDRKDRAKVFALLMSEWIFLSFAFCFIYFSLNNGMVAISKCFSMLLALRKFRTASYREIMNKMNRDNHFRVCLRISSTWKIQLVFELGFSRFEFSIPILCDVNCYCWIVLLL